MFVASSSSIVSEWADLDQEARNFTYRVMSKPIPTPLPVPTSTASTRREDL